jgi:hypothetical protein
MELAPVWPLFIESMAKLERLDFAALAVSPAVSSKVTLGSSNADPVFDIIIVTPQQWHVP